MRRIDLEVYGRPVDALIVSSNPRSLVLNFPLYILKLREPPIGYMVEFCPFWLCCYSRGCMCFGGGVVIAGDVDELENQRSSSDDTTAPG